MIRTGDTITVTFDEGPEGLTRPVTMELTPQSLVTGSPDIDTGTLAGVGPRDWSGRATLNPPPTVPASPLDDRHQRLLAGAFSRRDRRGPAGARLLWHGLVHEHDRPADLDGLGGRGRAGQDRRRSAAGRHPGLRDRPASTTVRIHDVSTDGQDLLIGSRLDRRERQLVRRRPR